MQIKEATNEEKRQANLILKKYKKENDLQVKAITESIIANGGKANLSRWIYPYIETYYNERRKKYKDDISLFKADVNATIQRYTINMSNYCGTEIFVNKKKGLGIYSLKDL